MYCNYNICNHVLYRGLRPPGNAFYHNKVSSYGFDLLIHIFGWYAAVLRAQLVCTVTITSVIMCCTEICDHLVMSFITIKSLHIDLIYSFIVLGNMQMFCGHNRFIVLISW